MRSVVVVLQQQQQQLRRRRLLLLHTDNHTSSDHNHRNNHNCYIHQYFGPQQQQRFKNLSQQCVGGSGRQHCRQHYQYYCEMRPYSAIHRSPPTTTGGAAVAIAGGGFHSRHVSFLAESMCHPRRRDHRRLNRCTGAIATKSTPATTWIGFTTTTSNNGNNNNNDDQNHRLQLDGTKQQPQETSKNHIQPMGLFRLFNDAQRTLLSEQQQFTEQVRLVARRVGNIQPPSTPTTSTHTNTNVTSRMDDVLRNTFVIVIAGEYNAGKSTVINALVGSKLVRTGSLPTTDCITIISSAASTTTSPSTTTTSTIEPPNNSVETRSLSLSSSLQVSEHDQGTTSSIGDVTYHSVSTLPLLHDMTIVDTPGTNAVLTDHTAMTMRILPSADLIVFITSADRPFPESERSLLESIAVLYRKNIIVVINKIDILDTTGGDHGAVEKQRIVQYVTEHASTLLGAHPVVIPISARDALAAKLTGRVDHYDIEVSNSNNESVWKRSNFGSLERYLQDTLTTETKIKSKLSSPIGVAEGILDQCKNRLQYEQKEFNTDIATLNLINSQFNAWKKELASDMQSMNKEIQSILMSEGQRGIVLLQRMHWKDLYMSALLDTSNLRREWEKTKSPLTMQQQRPQLHDDDATRSNVKGLISAMVTDMANSVALISRAQGQAMIEFLGKRPAMKNQTLLASVTTASQYEDTRRNLHNNFINVVNKHIDMDENEIQESLLNRLQILVYCTTALNVGSMSVAIACLTQVMDVTSGFMLCTLLLASTSLVSNVGRRSVVDQYASLWTLCSQRLDSDIDIICAKESDRVCRRIMDGITPYTLFVEAEQERLQQLTDQCEGLSATARQLRNRISDIG